MPHPPIALAPEAPGYPANLLATADRLRPPTLTCWGRPAWSNAATLALFCSAKAPASILLAVHDLAQEWRNAGPVLMSGFQSPVEDEALTVLLRGPQPVIVWLARGMVTRVRPQLQSALDAGRLTLVAPFAATLPRATTETALMRNRLLAAAADAVLFAHAQPGSKTELLARAVVGWGKPVYTLDHAANGNLLALGAQISTPG